MIIAILFAALFTVLAIVYGIAAIRDANYILRRLRSIRRELRRQPADVLGAGAAGLSDLDGNHEKAPDAQRGRARRHQI